MLALLGASRDVSGQSLNNRPLEAIKAEIKNRFLEIPVMTVEDLKSRMSKKSNSRLTLIDVRDFEEFAVSHLYGAGNYPMDQTMRQKILAFPHDRPLIVYCSVGYRSAKFAGFLRNNGFTNVYNLSGGIFEWANKGNPVFRDDKQVAEIHPYNRKWGKLLDPRLHWEN